MKILIFGASGATGQNLVSQALMQKHSVTAFVRSPSKFPIHNENINIFQGDVGDYQRVNEAIRNQEGVISALGASTPFKRDFTLIRGIQNIVTAMKEQKIRRFIYQSYLGVKEYRDELGFLIDKIVPVLLKNSITDHEAKEDLIIKSDLDWTIVRPPLLTNGSFKGSYRRGEHIKSSSVFPVISRADVAHFILNQLTDKNYLHKKPRILY